MTGRYELSKAVVFSNSDIGHRQSYLSFIRTLIPVARRGWWGAVFARSPVIFLMVEDGFGLYVVAALVRSLFKRRTMGLLFRPKPAVNRENLRLKLKYLLLKSMKSVGAISTITIEPFWADCRYGSIASNFIYDLQLWDLSDDQIQESAAKRVSGKFDFPISDDLKRLAMGRSIVLSVGAQSKDKGFHRFAEAYLGSSELREKYLFAFVGTVSPDCEVLAARLVDVGAFSLNKRISDQELLELYAVADIMWCYYAEGYDQASGILGRAIQLGVPAIVRKGTTSETVAKATGAKYISCRDIPVAQDLLMVEVGRGEVDMRHMAEHSKNVLRSFVGGGEA